MNEPWFGFSFFPSPHSRLMTSWIAMARRTDSSVGVDESEAIGERKGELRDRVRARLGDVIARDGGGVEIAHVVTDEVFLDVAHHFEGELGREDAGVLPLVLLEDVRLHGAANGRKRPRPDFPALGG